jgi:hypothetical protein
MQQDATLKGKRNGKVDQRRFCKVDSGRLQQQNSVEHIQKPPQKKLIMMRVRETSNSLSSDYHELMNLQTV